jgi:hypothetical protein
MQRWNYIRSPILLKIPKVAAEEETMAEDLQPQTNGADPVRVIVWYDYV